MSFHLLRPEWLWALIPVTWLLWKLWRRQQTQGQWQTLIDPQFQKVLLSDANQQPQFPWRIVGLAMIWITLIFALSGPTWKAVEQPAQKSGQATVILLDLSLSMLADDLKPNRISRAKFKLIDLLKQHPELSVGLVGYAGSAHALTPVSEDNQTLLALMKTLSPDMMPSFGSDAEAGIDKALALLAGANRQQQHLIWVLDDIEAAEVTPIVSKIKSADVSISLLAVGTANGSPIPMPNNGLVKDEQGQIVVAQLPFARLQSLAAQLDSKLTLIQNDSRDLQALLPPLPSSAQATDEQKADEQKKLKYWLDNGIYLLVGFLPLMALAFRRGWLLTVGLVFLLPGLVVLPQSSYAEAPSQTPLDFLDVFKSTNQQGYEKFQAGDFAGALDQFEDPSWRGATLYRLQKYAEAVQQFESLKGAQARFNQGNALAQMGKLEDAKAQYQKALAAQPNWQAAQQNLRLIEQLLQQQQKTADTHEKPGQNNQPRTDGTLQKPQSQADHSGNDLEQPQPHPQNDNTQNQQGDQSASDSDGQQQDKTESLSKADNPSAPPSQPEPASDSANSETGDAPDQQPKPSDKNGAASTADQPLTEEEQAQNAWLNQIPDDPSVFIKRKFEYQYQQQMQQSSEDSAAPKKIW